MKYVTFHLSILLADKVVVIDRGQIVEEGSHSELMNMHGFYYDLVKG